MLLIVPPQCDRHQQPVLFPPRVVWEDIEFNTLAREAALAVTKYARMIHLKRNFTPAVVQREIDRARSAPLCCLGNYPTKRCIHVNGHSLFCWRGRR